MSSDGKLDSTAKKDKRMRKEADLEGNSKKRPIADQSDDEDDEDGSVVEKKAGRRKINIEFIEDKSRRHITFSKRKAGIMKKAYELSTLTGTQVLLLVASETGHVYTFATPKLQPLITKPEGKNLIQACLNAPDNAPSVSSGQPPSQRMSTQMSKGFPGMPNVDMAGFPNQQYQAIQGIPVPMAGMSGVPPRYNSQFPPGYGGPAQGYPQGAYAPGNNYMWPNPNAQHQN